LRGRLTRWATLAALALLAAGCAHRLHLRPAYETSGRRTLYRTALEERRGAGLVTATTSVWLERAGKRLPGASGDFALLSPDRARLRVDSSFGTLVDLALQGDSVSAYLPSMRTGLRLGSARDSLQVDRPGELAVRALSGGWDPPESAWKEGAMWTDSLLDISWLDSGDSLHMGVKGDGLPAFVRLHRPSFDIRVDYRGWDRSAGPAWPTVMILQAEPGHVRLTLRATRMRFASRIDPSRLKVTIPQNADELTVEDLKDMLKEIGVKR
jgi:hypothetical protein